jgi:hypothetical protein
MNMNIPVPKIGIRNREHQPKSDDFLEHISDDFDYISII